jgi:hypothetical protein
MRKVKKARNPSVSEEEPKPTQQVTNQKLLKFLLLRKTKLIILPLILTLKELWQKCT